MKLRRTPSSKNETIEKETEPLHSPTIVIPTNARSPTISDLSSPQTDINSPDDESVVPDDRQLLYVEDDEEIEIGINGPSNDQNDQIDASILISNTKTTYLSFGGLELPNSLVGNAAYANKSPSPEPTVFASKVLTEIDSEEGTVV